MAPSRLYPEQLLLRLPSGTMTLVDQHRGAITRGVYLRQLVLGSLDAPVAVVPSGLRTHHDLLERRIRSMIRQAKFRDGQDPALPGLQDALSALESMSPLTPERSQRAA